MITINLYERIQDDMNTDDEDTDKISRKLVARYQALTDEQKEVVDDAFITLCGWSMATMISEL